MNNSKGFTLLEMMVAAGLLAIALAGAMSFFIYQSRSGEDSGKLKAARENLSLSLTWLRRDIQLAGSAVYGVAAISNPKAFSLFLMANYGVEKVTGDAVDSSPDTTLWNVADLPRAAASDPFLPTGATFRPDKIHVGYGNFLDMSYDIDGKTDTNSIFKYSSLRTHPTVQPPPIPRRNLPPEGLGSATNHFVYDLFQYAPGLAVTRNTKPVGGFIAVPDIGAAQAADIDWVATGDPATSSPPWNFTVTEDLSGKVAPSIVYRIAKDTKRDTYELQRNGIRIAGGDPGLEVYNLTVKDQSAGAGLQFSVRVDYQVKLTSSQEEKNLHGTAKKTWHKGWVTVGAVPGSVLVYAWPPVVY
jgi:prepilin-type N-terminal cleavage/methylation domain-containing protein